MSTYYYYPCSSCGHSPCSCHTSCNPCTTVVSGCPIQLDSACVFYHKDNSETSALTNLGITNGATLELILDTIDTYIASVKVSAFSLPHLRTTYVVNSMQQFAQSVDTALSSLATDVATALGDSQTPLTVSDSTTIDFTASSTLNHTLTASVKLSSVEGNRITSETDGLHVSAQNLSINYSTKELTIADGNTVSLASLLNNVSGFLGNLASDPTAVDGNYWYNTAEDAIKMKVNGVVKEIATV